MEDRTLLFNSIVKRGASGSVSNLVVARASGLRFKLLCAKRTQSHACFPDDFAKTMPFRRHFTTLFTTIATWSDILRR